MEIITAVFVVLLVILYLNLATSKQKRVAKYVDKLPGPKKYPLIGTSLNLIGIKRKDLCDFSTKRNVEYGPLYRSWIGSLPVVHLLKAHQFEKILNSATLLSKSVIYDPVKPWLGQGLLLASGAKWHKDRKLITPAFHFKILENFLEVMNEKAAILVDVINDKADGKTAFDMYEYITNCALDIICETAMGVQINAQSNSSSDYVNATHQITELGLERAIKPWLQSDFIFYSTNRGKKFLKCLEILHTFTKKVIRERKLAPVKPTLSENDADMGKRQRLALVDLLLEVSKGGTLMNDTDIREQVDTFMFAGHDTTTNATAWTLLLLGNHPEIQEKVRDEINSVFHGDKLTIQDLSEMKYLEMVIKESLRLFPSAPTIARLLTEDVTIDEYLIPDGVTIVMHIIDIHRDPEYYPEPEKFDPERFLPENCVNRHPYAYVPFSAGARNCIGQKFAMCEEKTLLTWILKNYRVRGTENYRTAPKFKEIVLKPQNGLKIILERI